MAQNEPDGPEPPPLIRTAVPPLDPEDQAAQAQAEYELQLWDAGEQSKKLQPTFVNRAFVKIEGRMLRISFGERIDDEDIYRSSIMMTPEDAYALGQLLMSQSELAYGVVIDHYRQVLKDIDNPQEPDV